MKWLKEWLRDWLEVDKSLMYYTREELGFTDGEEEEIRE
jgi:hypothetical protein